MVHQFQKNATKPSFVQCCCVQAFSSLWSVYLSLCSLPSFSLACIPFSLCSLSLFLLRVSLSLIFSICSCVSLVCNLYLSVSLNHTHSLSRSLPLLSGELLLHRVVDDESRKGSRKTKTGEITLSNMPKKKQAISENEKKSTKAVEDATHDVWSSSGHTSKLLVLSHTCLVGNLG